MSNPHTQIRPMNKAEFEIWLPHCIKEFAKEKAQAMEISQDQALQLSEESFETILQKDCTRLTVIFSLF